MLDRARLKELRAQYPGLTEYEIEREERIKSNHAVMVSMGILEQKTLFEAAFRIVKKPTIRKGVIKKGKVKRDPLRASSRLAGSQPQFKGLADDYTECCDGRIELPKVESSRDVWTEAMKERRCDSQSRGSLYDSKAGITCHFCRQKKLCGEPDCKRCSERDPSLPCAGKSECSRCGSANGRFCRACLLIRYGWQLEDVKKQMAEGSFLCPHCYEEDHPDEGWICNSSICMTRRGLKPTGIAIFDAQQQGFASVAHHLQARLLQHRKGASAKCTQAPANGGAEPKKPARLGKENKPQPKQNLVCKVDAQAKDTVTDAAPQMATQAKRMTRSTAKIVA